MIYRLFFFIYIASGWLVQTTGIDSSLRGIAVALSAAESQTTVLWATGSHGVILRSIDAGKNWQRFHVPNGDELDFRGVQAFGPATAYVMASGEGEKSGILKTTDAGKTWEKQFSDSRKEFFLDALACSTVTDCFALSDPVDGKFRLIHTTDGSHWKEMPSESMPAALPKEGAFAASNRCLILFGSQDIYFATGGPAARVFHSTDSGKTWTVSETPILSGKPAEGIFSLARRGKTVVAVGGDYELARQSEKVAAYSLDEGKTWKLSAVGPGGYRSAIIAGESSFIAAGPTGTESSEDGTKWVTIDSTNLNALTSMGQEVWGVGSKGTIAKLQYR